METVRNQRWLIGSAGRSPNPWWQAVDTVSAAKQELFLERLLFSFSVRKKQCRNASTARITGEAWEQLLETSCLLHQILEEMSSAKTAEGGGLFLEEDLVKARRRGIEGYPASDGLGFRVEYVKKASIQGQRDETRL